MHYFFVPNRILWDNWEKFITDANSGIVAPHLKYENFYAGSTFSKFMDYLGVPPQVAGGTSTDINMLPMAAYQCIYNEFYRDQNLIEPIDYKLRDGAYLGTLETYNLLTMRKRAWQHDYFTSSLPWAQKGDAIDIPIGNIDGFNLEIKHNLPGGTGDTTISATPYDIEQPIETTGTIIPGELYTKLPDINVEPTTINELRRAFKLQEWLERNARGGTRYIENILSHFGVKSSDSRLQRPEYITGVKNPIVISEVLNTTGQEGGLPQGNMAGHGIGVTSGNSGSYYCEEHGFIIGIMSIMPQSSYQQGIPKQFIKNDPLEYFWPSFAHIGEQPVENQELFAYTPEKNGTFGYVPRYAEYKYFPSRVAGDFRTSLNYWHLGRIFDTAPALNKEFLECNPSKRIFAVESGTDSFYCHVLNKIRATRPMPKYGTPQF
jgi:hypothetical protein